MMEKKEGRWVALRSGPQEPHQAGALLRGSGSTHITDTLKEGTCSLLLKQPPIAKARQLHFIPFYL